MKIGIFGGSFNPVHNGHVGIAKSAIERLSLDSLLVVPAAVNPFKAGGAAEDPPFDRLLLVRAAFCGMAKVVVDDREMRRGGVSYAIDTVREIASENPGAELFFITGEDIAGETGGWKDAGELKRLCKFETFPRTAESSTEIRALLREGKSVAGLVPEAVGLLLRHRVSYNEDAKIVAAVLKGLQAKGGYCPCRLQKIPEFVCPCEEFRSQLADGSYHGLCHCRLYKKP
jgi:nicotinate-nucleotide adenylyltransferase